MELSANPISAAPRGSLSVGRGLESLGRQSCPLQQVQTYSGLCPTCSPSPGALPPPSSGPCCGECLLMYLESVGAKPRRSRARPSQDWPTRPTWQRGPEEMGRERPGWQRRVNGGEGAGGTGRNSDKLWSRSWSTGGPGCGMSGDVENHSRPPEGVGLGPEEARICEWQGQGT